CQLPYSDGAPGGLWTNFWTSFQSVALRTSQFSVIIWILLKSLPSLSWTLCSTTSISTPARPGSPSGSPIVGDWSQKEHHSPGDSLNRIFASKYPYIVSNFPCVLKTPVRLMPFSVYVLICSIPFATTSASG